MRTSSIAFFSAALLLPVVGCSASGDVTSGGLGGGDSSSASHAQGSTGSGTLSSSSGGPSSGTTNPGDIKSLAVEPAAATIDVQDGASTPAHFKAIATHADGSKSEVDASWTFDHAGLATIQGSTVTARGQAGGVGTLTASIGGKTGSASVKIVVHVTQNVGAVSPGDIAKLDAPDGDPSGTLLYPYDGTVFARGLVAPEVMWDGGVAGDVYLVHLHDDYFDLKLYTTAEPPSAVTLDQATWANVTASNLGEPLTLDVTRLSGGQAHAPMHAAFKVAQGSLRGSIYYWAVNQGQLMKVAPGATTPDLVFDSGPNDQLGTPAPQNYDGSVPPWSAGGGGKRCVACHSVSKDGSTVAAVFERKDQTQSPWGTVDLTAPTPGVVQMSSYDSAAIYLALSPEGKLAVHNDATMNMRLADAKTGAAIPSLLDGFTDAVCDPAFSPDGKKLAFSGDVTGAYPVEFTRADLELLDFDPGTMAFTNRRKIVMGGAEAIAFASFSPDSSWVFFQKGDYSRAKYGANQVGHDDLFLTDAAGTTGAIALAAASGATLDAKNQHLAYQPTVNPISVGGYSWVVFVSPRDYGNKMRSATDPTYENRKQLWVAAVDANPTPGQDPSHPAFWLPGQDLTTINMSGYWALEPCRQNGATCEAGFECCGGFCKDDGSGNAVCSPQSSGCSGTGDKCTTAADCCDTKEKCVGGFCAADGPH